MSARPLALAFFLCSILPPSGFAQRKELVQLQRDMALLQDTVRQMQQETAERLVALEALVKQGTDKQDKLAAGQAVIERSVAALDDALTEPQRTTAAKVDSLTDQFSSLRASVEEMGVAVEDLQSDVRDIKTHLTMLPAPTEGEEGTEAAGVGGSDAVFEGAMNDYLRGNIDVARAQFMDYLALYPTHGKAGEAQFYLAETYYSAADYEEAARQFDQVYKRYPLSKSVPDSFYKKGLSLTRLRGREDEAIKALESVLDKFPDSDVAPHARAELNSLKNAKPSPGL